MAGQRSEENEIDAVSGLFWSGSKAYEALQVASEVLASQTEAGEVLGLVRSDGATVYPVWSFQRGEGQVEVHPALRRCSSRSEGPMGGPLRCSCTPRVPNSTG